MRRGRPPYPDILTPREQEVLALLREGLTNQQIADRLGISLYGARYHVSEILSKLGVSSREEAARWQPESRVRWKGLGIFLAPFGKLSGVSAFKLAGGATIGAAGVALGLLALGVLVTAMREEPQLPEGLGKVAYIQDSNLWVRDLPDGTPVQLTHDNQSTNPQWSPSGEWILTGVEVMREDGTERRRVQLCSEWSPVADELLCIWDNRAAYEGLRIEKPDGQLVRTIDVADLVQADAPELEIDNVVCLEWSPDGTRLACRVNATRPPLDDLPDTSLKHDPSGAGAYSRYSGLWIVESDGSGAAQVVDNFEVDGNHGELIPVAWTADGASVLFQIATAFSVSMSSGGMRLYRVPADGGVVLEIEGQLPSRDELQDWHLAEDVFTVTEGGRRETWTDKRIALADLRSGRLHFLTDADATAFSPAVSPDGSLIAFVAAPDIGDVPGGDQARDGAAQRRIWLMDRDGTDKRQLTRDDAYRDERPLWSRDGRFVLFARIDLEDRASLWLLDVQDGQPRKVTELSTRSSTSSPPLWFGYYGYVGWNAYYDWWQP